MVIVFLCIYCAKIVYDNEMFPARKRLTLRACAVDSFRHQHFWNGCDFCSLFSMYRNKFDAKITKSKWNYTANMIMNVSETVCQRIHYFQGKQWLAIDPTWPALKLNNAHGFDISWSCSFIYIFILMIYTSKLLKAFPPKHLKNSSAQWTILFLQLYFFNIIPWTHQWMPADSAWLIRPHSWSGLAESSSAYGWFGPHNSAPQASTIVFLPSLFMPESAPTVWYHLLTFWRMV